jgi:hypothetical protein
MNILYIKISKRREAKDNAKLQARNNLTRKFHIFNSNIIMLSLTSYIKKQMINETAGLPE